MTHRRRQQRTMKCTLATHYAEALAEVPLGKNLAKFIRHFENWEVHGIRDTQEMMGVVEVQNMQRQLYDEKIVSAVQLCALLQSKGYSVNHPVELVISGKNKTERNYWIVAHGCHIFLSLFRETERYYIIKQNCWTHSICRDKNWIITRQCL